MSKKCAKECDKECAKEPAKEPVLCGVTRDGKTVSINGRMEERHVPTYFPSDSEYLISRIPDMTKTMGEIFLAGKVGKVEFLSNEHALLFQARKDCPLPTIRAVERAELPKCLNPALEATKGKNVLITLTIGSDWSLLFGATPLEISLRSTPIDSSDSE